MRGMLLVLLLSRAIGESPSEEIITREHRASWQGKLARDVWAGEAMNSVVTSANTEGDPQEPAEDSSRCSPKQDCARMYRMEGCHVSKPRCLDFLVELLDILDQHNLTKFPKQAESVLRWKCGAEKCGTCAVVGNAWHLVGSSFGEEIDKNDLVIRFGGAVEHVGFEGDVGTRSDLRVVYHSTAPRRRVSDGERILHLLTRFAAGGNITKDEDHRVLLFSPWLIQAARKQLGWEDSFSSDFGKRFPSAGLSVLAWTLQHCKRVNSYGFGGGQPQGAWHYWELPEEASRTKDHSWDQEEEVSSNPPVGPHSLLILWSQVWSRVFHGHVKAEPRRFSLPNSWQASPISKLVLLAPVDGSCVSSASVAVYLLYSRTSDRPCRQQVCAPRNLDFSILLDGHTVAHLTGAAVTDRLTHFVLPQMSHGWHDVDVIDHASAGGGEANEKHAMDFLEASQNPPVCNASSVLVARVPSLSSLGKEWDAAGRDGIIAGLLSIAVSLKRALVLADPGERGADDNERMRYAREALLGSERTGSSCSFLDVHGVFHFERMCSEHGDCPSGLAEALRHVPADFDDMGFDWWKKQLIGFIRAHKNPP
ncbi:hypothetical protein GUITHDRAFT_147787 [Guillardia theta CCMP2712]|uniref:Uncharacterized protein n=1 Tax=Guillardia theta (strain CCMP2712) TaxID=905079 RepID=L1IBH3_GUITC|nr:hypothetical protein GUITHDRAFT_147787 [Guillardia theta CCMP2712]EKX33611.1 hypothetical protein GUITHDRAFT_147787 [Guillardia theta CCMP2712]|eukprot:XP_005820591.1 hypothetical protein GUITHDRAFT_147787 [Guillardia theta CCMP2712]